MVKLYRFLVLSALIYFGLASTQGFSQTIDQHHSADSLQAGDLFSFSITLKKDQPYDRVIYPDTSDFTDDIELRDKKEFRVADFKDSLHYQLQFWATTNATIPALPVKLISGSDTTIIYTNPVPLAFKSVLKGEKDKEELRPLKPIFDFAAAWLPYIIGFLLLLLIAGLAYYLYQRYRTRPEAKPAAEFQPQPFLNPLKELQNNLRQLQNVSLTTREHFEQYYISLGNAIRLYFEQMYRIPAMESSSREIIHELNQRAIDEKLIEQTRIVLREADLVKFANFSPTQEEAKKTYQKAEDFLAVAQKLHGQRIQQMQRQHIAREQEARQKFDEQQNKEEA